MNFSTTNYTYRSTNKVFCVNFAADIKWRLGRLNLNVFKNPLCRGGVAMYEIVGMWLMQSFYDKPGPR